MQHDGNGYAMIILHKNKQLTPIKIHRLVALLFVPNPENKPMVNHKDGNKMNSYYKNLEWVTRSENERHAWATGLKTYNENQRQASIRNMRENQKRRWK